MKGGNKLFLFAGVGLALVAILLGITMSSGDKKVDAVKQEAPTKITVVRLIQDIEPHQIIKTEMVETVELDTTVSPTDAVTSVASVVNQAYMFNAASGDVLLNAYVEAPGITSSIDAGMRAISLRVDQQGAMSGLIVSGDYVDVVFLARVDLQSTLPVPTVTGIDASSTKKGSEVDAASDAQRVPFEGQEGSEFAVLDAGGELEPVAKMLVQDLKVIRVIAPGASYDGQGQQVQRSDESGPSADTVGQLIVQVTPQQAEAIAFVQDANHTYSVTVRGKDDHTIDQTSGITFQILMTDGTWSLPWPMPVIADEAAADRATPMASPSDDASDTETT